MNLQKIGFVGCMVLLFSANLCASALDSDDPMKEKVAVVLSRYNVKPQDFWAELKPFTAHFKQSYHAPGSTEPGRRALVESYVALLGFLKKNEQ